MSFAIVHLKKQLKLATEARERIEQDEHQAIAYGRRAQVRVDLARQTEREIQEAIALLEKSQQSEQTVVSEGETYPKIILGDTVTPRRIVHPQLTTAQHITVVRRSDEPESILPGRWGTDEVASEIDL